MDKGGRGVPRPHTGQCLTDQQVPLPAVFPVMKFEFDNIRTNFEHFHQIQNSTNVLHALL